MDYEVIKSSGLYQKGELESILGVSRMSISKYFGGRTIPRKAVQLRIKKLSAIVKSLTTSGMLPFNEGTLESTRRDIIRRVIEVINK